MTGGALLLLSLLSICGLCQQAAKEEGVDDSPTVLEAASWIPVQDVPEDALLYPSRPSSLDDPLPIVSVVINKTATGTDSDEGMLTGLSKYNLDELTGSSAISLAIVFDSTGSMGNDLKQVKIGSRRILQRHMQRGEANYIKDFVLVKVHDPDVGPARVTTSTKTFYQYLDSVYTQGGGDCPEMTITGIELALEASRPNSLIYVFTDSSAKDYNRTDNVLNLIQQKQSQVVFVLTGFCNSTDEPGFEAYRQIATVSSGQLYIIGKGQVKEFMQVVEAAVEARKVHVLQQDTEGVLAKTYSFPVDSHLTQLTVQVTNHHRDQPIDVRIRNPEGKLITPEDGLKRLMKAVPSVFVASLDRPKPGQWTLEVGTAASNDVSLPPLAKDQPTFSVRVSGISDVDFLQGFATTQMNYNQAGSRQPIAGVKNYVMVNMTGRLVTGRIENFDMRAPSGKSVARLPVKQTPNTQIYVSQHPLEALTGHYYLEVSGRDAQGFTIQRYSKVALSARKPRPIVITCPAKVELQRGATAQLSCAVTSEVSYTIKWFKDGSPLVGHPNENRVYNFPSSVHYTIADANEDSQGIYAAQVQPTHAEEGAPIEGEYRDEVAVIILPPPPRVLIPRNASVEPGSDAVLICNIFSLDESVQIRWYRGLEPRFELRDGRRHRLDVQQAAPGSALTQALISQLTIVSATKSDAGRYICEARHKGGVSEADGFLLIHVLPEVTVDSSLVTFREGGSLVLTCQAEGFPEPNIVWFFNKQPLPEAGSPEAGRYTVTESFLESSLMVSPAKPEDAGAYKCVAINSAGNHSSTITANIISPPVIEKLEMATTAPVVGQEQTLTCFVSGKPKPRIRWDFNGSPVTNSPTIQIDEKTGTLRLTSVEEKMKGEWTCSAENLAGAARQSIQMDVGYSAQILKEMAPTKVLAEFAMDATLLCPAIGQPAPDVKWYRVTNTGNVPIKFGDRYFFQADNSLLIRGVNMEDGGHFVCEAVNTYGKDTLTIAVDIGGTKAPMISFTSPKQVALLGMSEKRLVCTVMDAKPAATVMWLKDNQPIEFPSTLGKYHLDKHDLIITNIQEADEGVYTCIARNVVGKAKFDIELDVQAKPVFIDPKSGVQIEVTQGDILILECQVDGDPKPVVEWRKDGRRILPQGPGGSDRSPGLPSGLPSPLGGITNPGGQTIVVSPDGHTLTVYSVTEASAGSFTCSAINAHSVETKEFKVSVKIPPTITKEGQSDFELGQQEVAVLTCLVSVSQPPAKIRWLKDGKPLLHSVPGRIAFSDNDQTLEIKGYQEEDSGSYECRAENEAGYDSRFYQVTILVPPVVTKVVEPMRRLVSAGQRVELACGMAGYPDPKITWKWNDRPLTDKTLADGFDTGLGMQIVSPADGEENLVIREMTPILQGNYTCSGTNKGGTKDFTYEVILLDKPKIENFHEKAVVFVNNTITLTCEATGSPPPKINWFFRNQPLDPSLHYGYRLVGPRNLMLMSARPQQGGEYTCVAENEAGSTSATTVLTVFEPTTDQRIESSATIKVISVGGNITFTCEMSSNPPAQIRWYKDDSDIYGALPQDRFKISSDGATLTLFNVVAKDQGQYKCRAINIPGSWTYKYTLEVTSSPGIIRHSSSPPAMTFSEGHEIRLQCLATAHPEPVYQWLKDDAPLTMQILAITEGGTGSQPAPEVARLNTTTVGGTGSRYTLHDQGRVLLIRNSQIGDAGRYTCVASNSVGEDRIDVNVAVTSPPGFPDGVDHETPVLERSKPGSLWCNATGHPEPEIIWEYELPASGPGDRNLQTRNNGRQLYFPNVDYGVVTRFVCKARSRAGETRRVFDPTLVYSPTLTGSEGQNPRPVIVDGSTRLFCDWDASPRATVEWFKDGELIDSLRFTHTNLSATGSQLYLNNAQAGDAGNYRCVVSNKYGQASRLWRVDVMYPPSIRFSTPEGVHVVPLRTSLALFCVANGHPPPKITWTRDGKPVDLTKFTVSEDHVHLRLAEVDEDSGGRYACHVNSQYGQASRTFDVKVTYGPRLDTDGQLQYSLERTVGGSALLECLVSGNPQPKISWYKDGVRLEQLPYRYRLINQDRQLEIIGMQPIDAGRYKCVAENSYGQVEVNTDLVVGAPARIDRGRVRTDYTVLQGDELVLSCPATGSPHPKIEFVRTSDAGLTQSSWYDGRPSSPSGVKDSLPRQSVVSQERQTLTLFRANRADSGTYQCNASNAVGWDIMEYIVRVRVPPTFDTSNVQPEVHWFVNQTRSLDCTLMTGIDPAPVIKWERHGLPIVSGPDIQVSPDGSRVTVPQVQNQDAGEYVCHAQNEVGKSTQLFNVLVYVRPKFLDSTRRINIQAVQNETIQLSCEASGDPRPRFAWFRRDIEILKPRFGGFASPAVGQSNTVVMSGDQVLHIANIQLKDAGEYACTASNGGGTIEKKFNISVIVRPVILKRSELPEDHQTREYLPITFYCLVRDYNQTKPEITWTKDGAPVLMSAESDYFVIQDHGQSLTVVRPTGAEAGTYRCVAKNLAGEDSHNFHLTVIAPPRFPSDFIRFREKLTIKVGSVVELDCPVTGSPPPTVQWYNNGAPLTAFNAPSKFAFEKDHRVLRISPATSNDAGEYVCLARNDAGNVSKVYELEVIMPPLVRLDRANIREREGATFTVQCSAEGHPKPMLHWSRDTGGLFRLGTSVDIVTGLLTVTDAKIEDAGRYTCTAINKISEDSKSVTIEIIERPTIHTSLDPILVKNGDQVLLPCQATGTQPIRLQWLLPTGQLLTSGQTEAYRVIPDQGLHIENVQPQHAGRYRCSASNEAGFQNALISLEVVVPPKLIRPMTTDVSGRLNSVLQLHCEVESGIPPPTVLWQRDGVVFGRTKSYYTTTESGLFIFNSLKREDEGELSCIAKNAAGEDKLTFRISVQVPPRVTIPVSTIGYEDQSVTITCQVEGHPAPEVLWEFKGQPLATYLGNRVRFDRPNQVTIHGLQPSDGGGYFCIARSAGQDMAMDSTYLTVFTKPRFERTPNKTTVAYENRWIQFRCVASGHPRPEIRWAFANEPILSNPSKNGIGSLVLGPLRTDQAGHYACVAKNDAGKVEYPFELHVKSRPRVHLYQSDQPSEAREEELMTRLRCDVVSGDADSMTWLKDGNVVSNSSRISITDQGQSLTIRMTKARDTGVYQCIAANPVGEDLGEFRLVVDSKPSLVTAPRNTTVQSGSVTTLECQAEGQPLPIISWYKDGQLLTLEGTRSLVLNGSLRIVGVSHKDSGVYHCVASSSLGEDFSAPAHLFVQVDGGWSPWSSWSACSKTCGHGSQTRDRSCTEPSPLYGGRQCVGESSEARTCLLAFCPVDGVWGVWTPWSPCTATCGAGLSTRQRRCDSPPPANGGQICPGDAIEEVMCQGLPACPVSGSWSPWSPWSECAAECGTGGTQSRNRLCDNPPPVNGGRSCVGKDLEVRACNRRPCPTDGAWGVWSAWSHCSKSCGGGQRRRIRRCDHPAPAYGGKDCPSDGLGFTEFSDCQQERCPVHGEWSNWSSWSPCSRKCGTGLQTRERECNQPPPSFGGHLCRGSAKEVRTCEEQRPGSSPMCPSAEGSSPVAWSEWSEWSKCEPTCAIAGEQQAAPVQYGWQRRIRSCRLVGSQSGDDAKRSSQLVVSASSCPGPEEEVQTCPLSGEDLRRCATLPSGYPKSGRVFGHLHGTLNKADIGVIPVEGNWSSPQAGSSPTSYEIHLTKVPSEFSACLQAMTEVYSPVLWYAAQETEGASNGHRVWFSNLAEGSRDPGSALNWKAVGQFADGSQVELTHQLTTVGEEGSELRIDTLVNGTCPVGLAPNKTPGESPKVQLSGYREDIVQMNPLHGELHAHSSRVFGIRQPSEWSSSNEPYTWTSILSVGRDKRQRHLTQELHVARPRLRTDVEAGSLSFQAEAHLSKPVGDGVCSPGFRLQTSRVTGGSDIGGSASAVSFVQRDYCQDVDECAQRELNNCDQVCTNTVPHFTCSCHSGYRLSADGHSCIDLDECSPGEIGDTFCAAQGLRCVNTHGRYECRQTCAPGLTISRSGETCEDIDECNTIPNPCGIHNCVNTYGGYHCDCSAGYRMSDNVCQDIDECLTESHHCRENEQCVNLPGTFKCYTACPAGYRVHVQQQQQQQHHHHHQQQQQQQREHESTTNRVECIDIDECASNVAHCPPGSRCFNEPGGYTCRCASGILAGAQGCDDRKEPTCNDGFQWNEEKGCIDVNECLTSTVEGGLPACQYKCVNTYGSYRCECPHGYKLDSRTNLCQDVDECHVIPQPCQFDEFCLNVPGNYTCVKKKCPKDYVFDQRSRSCRIRCVDSKLQCPHGARYADTVEYLAVSFPPPNNRVKVVGSRVKLRVVDWNQVQQANCRYSLLDKAPGTPVVHHSAPNGVVYLSPIWATMNGTSNSVRLDPEKGSQTFGLLAAQLTNQEISPTEADELISRFSSTAGKLYYLFFRVSCYSNLVLERGPTLSSAATNREPSSSSTSVSGQPEMRQSVRGRGSPANRLIFQHSFYVYISIAKYNF